VEEIEFSTRVADAREKPPPRVAETPATYADEVDREEFIKILEEEMRQAAEALDFERAALLRDQLFELQAQEKEKGKKGRKTLAGELRAAAEKGT
jgi:excinuclease ABC subunit B